MPSAGVFAIAALAGVMYFGGRAVVHGTNNHIIKPIKHHVVKIFKK